ncbi:MAG: TolC family protein, partial [bacterium]
FPDLSVGFKYIDMGEAAGPGTRPDDSGQDAYLLNLGINIPLWWGKRTAALTEAKLKRSASEMERDNLKNDLFSRIKVSFFKIKNFERLITLYKESLIPQAASTLQTAETWYKQKKGSLSGMLETEITWLKFNLAQKQAMADYYRQIAVMELLVGKLLKLGKTG